MYAYVSPGAYVREVDLSLYIPAISTTIFGVVGTATKGATDTATFVSSQADFVEKFGSPDPDCMMTYAAMQFLRRGRQLWVVRVAGSDVATSDVDIVGGPVAGYVESTPNAFTLTAPTYGTCIGSVQGPHTLGASDRYLKIGIFVAGVEVGSSPYTIDLGIVSLTTQGVADLINAAVGTYLTADVVDDPVSPTQVYAAGANANGYLRIRHDTFGSTTYFNLQTVSNSAADAVGLGTSPASAGTGYGENEGNNAGTNGTNMIQITTDLGTTAAIYLTAGSRTSEQVVQDLNDSGELTAVGVTASATSDGRVRLTRSTSGAAYYVQVHADSTCDAYEVMDFDNSQHPGSDGGVLTTCTIEADSDGTWGNNLRVVVSAGSESGTFKIQVYEQNVETESYLLHETWDNLVAAPVTDDQYYSTVINHATTGSRYIAVTDITGVAEPPANGTYDLTGGDNGLDNITDSDYIGHLSTPTGLQIFSSSELLDVNLLAVPGISSDAVVAALITLCETRADCLGIVDPPYGLDVSQVVDWHNGAGSYTSHAAWNSSYACLYWPWIQIFDPYNNQNVWTAPSGHAASVMAYTDYIRHIWFAPAGLQRGILTTALQVEYSPSQGDRDLMYNFPNNVNPIVNFTGQGIVVWGQKTLYRTSSAIDRINVRRLLLYARKVIATTVRYLVFEPNDSTTWRAFHRLVNPWFRNVKQKRGLYDFRVVCDDTTNPPEQIDQSVMVGKIYLQPTKAAEIIIVDFVLTSTGASFEEAIY